MRQSEVTPGEEGHNATEKMERQPATGDCPTLAYRPFSLARHLFTKDRHAAQFASPMLDTQGRLAAAGMEIHLNVTITLLQCMYTSLILFFTGSVQQYQARTSAALSELRYPSSLHRDAYFRRNRCAISNTSQGLTKSRSDVVVPC